MINTKIVNKKLIKPRKPTPQNLKNYKLSFIDELSPRMEVGVLLFYDESNTKRRRLEESLAETLVKLYPLAGRYNEKHRSVDCNDQGAEFVEAEALDVELKDLIMERDLEKLKGFFPYKNHKLVDESIDSILSIQTTELKGGGLVVGISVSHRVFDAASLGIFVAAWSSTACGNSQGIDPRFDCSTLCPSLFPSKNQIEDNDEDVDFDVEPHISENGTSSESKRASEAIPEPPKPVVKMFSFNDKAITRLRSKYGISRVRAVSAVVMKALIGVDRAKPGNETRPSLVVQAVNIRARTIPPLPKHSCGNLVIMSCMEASSETKEIEIKELVDQLGHALDKSVANCKGILSMDEDELNNIAVKPVVDGFEKFLSGEANVLWLSDWSRLGLYEADFGWGKPVWTSMVGLPNSNTVVLMGNKEGNGIEAWVHLDKNDMDLFEQDEGIRTFTT